MNKNKVTRFLALMLGMTTVLSMTACQGSVSKDSQDSSQKTNQSVSNESSQESSKTSESEEIPVDKFAGTELTIAISKRASDLCKDFNDKYIIQETEKATGIHINWIVMDMSVVGERVNVMLSSRELPDAMLGIIGNDALVTNKDLFYDLSEEGLLETYAPNVLKDYEEGGQDILNLITMYDGSIRSLAGNLGYSPNNETGPSWMINQDWLDQLGLEIPTTADEFYEVLCAFRDNDMNGNGDKNDEIPLSFCNNNVNANFINLLNAFGIGGPSNTTYYRVEDGKVIPTLDNDAYRASLEYYHKLAKDGLLDVEGFSQTAEQFSSKINEGKIGVIIDWEQPKNSTSYVGMRPFRGLDDVDPIKQGARNNFAGSLNALVASAECSNIEALLHWWNYMSSNVELKYYARIGLKDQTWYLLEDGTVFNGKSPNADYGELSHTEMVQTHGLSIAGTPYIMPSEIYFDPTLPKSIMADLVRDMCPTEYIKTKLVNSTATEDRTFIEADLLPMIASFMATSVVEGVTDASWESYLKDLETYQYYEWIDWWQKYLDNEL